MDLKQIQNKIIEQIGRETIDKFIEDKDGNLTGIVTISVAELVKDIYEAAKVDYTEQNERLKYKLGLIVKDNQELQQKLAILQKDNDKLFAENHFKSCEYCEKQNIQERNEAVAENNEYFNKIEKALEIAYEYSQIDGAHHKAWCIDQIVRVLLADKYDEWIKDYEYDAETDEHYEWDVGIEP